MARIRTSVRSRTGCLIASFGHENDIAALWDAAAHCLEQRSRSGLRCLWLVQAALFSGQTEWKLNCRALQYLGTQRAQLRKLVKPTGKRLWMSEFGCGSSPPSDMGAALELSAMIMRVRSYGILMKPVASSHMHTSCVVRSAATCGLWRSSSSGVLCLHLLHVLNIPKAMKLVTGWPGHCCTCSWIPGLRKTA